MHQQRAKMRTVSNQQAAIEDIIQADHPTDKKALPAHLRQQLFEQLPQAYNLHPKRIGYTTTIPTDLETFSQLQAKQLTEEELIQQALAENRDFKTSEGIYLQNVFIHPLHQTNGEATTLAKKTIKQLNHTRTKPIYTQTNSLAGYQLINKLAKELDNPIYNAS